MDKNVAYTIISRCFKGCLIKHGKALRAENLLTDLLLAIRKMLRNKHPLEALATVLLGIKPAVSLRKKKHGGTSFQLPYVITQKKGLEIAIHWFIKEAFSNATRFSMIECLIKQFSDCYTGRNRVFKKRRDLIHQTALVNRPFLRLK
jgi:small subunit ribosomal protein S7